MNTRSLEHIMAEPGHVADSQRSPAGGGCWGASQIEAPFPATVRGVDRTGMRFEAQAVLDSLSTYGLSMNMEPPVEPGAVLLVVVRFSTNPAHACSAPGVAVRGVVLRTARLHDGRWDVVMALTRHRFLYASAT